MADLADITWHLDAYAGHWLSDDELRAVTDWMADNHLDRATAEHPVVVHHGIITYGQDRSPSTVRAPHRDIVTMTTPLRTTPPVVRKLNCTVEYRDRLHETFRHHEWSSGFGGVCVDCSDIQVGPNGRIWCHRDDATPWPCPPVALAVAAAGIAPEPQRRIIGDCLNPNDNAKVFATTNDE